LYDRGILEDSGEAVLILSRERITIDVVSVMRVEK